jgi:hypothetical protein
VSGLVIRSASRKLKQICQEIAKTLIFEVLAIPEKAM